MSMCVGKSAIAMVLLVTTSVTQARTDVLGQVDYELTAYAEDATYGPDAGLKNSVALRGEVYQDWDDGYQSITFKPFYRWDENDEERTHGDIRELIWHKVGLGYELKAGIGKVFWGVTESAHLVDIINQTDLVESIDGEQKLGQPMIQLLLERDWGNLDLFVLPYQRERTLPGQDGRLSGGLAYDDTQYESDQEQSHVAVAGRYYTYIDQLEYAFSVFHGTSREPVLGVSQLSGNVVPYYPLINQLGLEVQYLDEGWAWKLESIYRDGMPEYSIEQFGQRLAVLQTPSGLQVADDEAYWSSVAGFEYTQVGVFDSRIDLGWVAEHLYDSRQAKASLSAFEHDVLLGTRWSFNDAEESTLLVGMLYDYEYQDYGLSLEGSTRLDNRLSVDVEARVFAPSSQNPQFGLRDDDFIEITLQYYF
ncbi:hypothetical protein HF888_07055 [Bermanella marisrubri]|uniref:Uncharacterized protein n=1 Tax=Bermanella marisrubri TaxID=207949 RepID=Q1N546_9GAMM|nr:hypothetical protein [Bermanella marisrubri]EAT13232.1 hypothetical protein RED65_00690 [Oceanobacter sp. RED65] [Bermanella marisrubri]QIZ84001.1 hypothetical protein HF888_07055 [Bermanella marisrubri]